MSHATGKIEILGIMDDKIYFKYHEAKDRKNIVVMFKRPVSEKAGWLDDLNPYEDIDNKKVRLTYPALNWAFEEKTEHRCTYQKKNNQITNDPLVAE